MTTPKRRPRSRPETLRKRAEILRAAVEIFGSKGYANGTLAEIAEHVGLTHAGVLHHFGSKDQLLLEVLQYRDESDVAELDTKHIPDGPEFFAHLVSTAFLNAQRAGLVQAYTVLSSESVTDHHPARDYFVERYRALRSEAEHAFEVMCAQRGVTSPEAITQGSAGVLAVMDGLQVQWLLDPRNVDLGKASEFAIEAIVAAVLGAGNGAGRVD